MNLYLTLFIFLFFNSSVVNAENLALPASQCACSPGAEDKLEDPSKFNFGVFAGLCVDSCRYRRSSFLHLDRGSLVEKTEVAPVVSNFMHEDKYWKARIPLDKVERADVGFEEFLPGVFHVFLVFHFPQKSPVLLYPQERSQNSDPVKVYDLVLSPEGIPPSGKKYNLVDAYMDRYLMGVRVLSKSQVVSWSVQILKHKISLYSLLLNQHEIKMMLRQGLLAGEKDSFRAKYGLFSNNCATHTLDLIDTVVKPEVTEFPIYYNLFYSLERSLPIAGPLGTLHVFLSRNLIEQNAKALL